MKISELFRQLSFGELSNLAISNSGSGSIVEEKWPQLILYVNSALAELYSRFLISERELIIEQVANITDYYLMSRHSESVGTAVDRYIKDTPEDPFQDDLIRVLSVWDLSGSKMPLNDQEDPNSLFTPSPLVLQVPQPLAGAPLSILYQAQHEKLDDVAADGDEPIIVLDQIIEIPHYLENPLQLLVASKVFSHMNGQENIVKGQEHRLDYENACAAIEQRDLANQTSHTTHNKLEQRGFV